MLGKVVFLGLLSLSLGAKLAKKEAPVHFDSSTMAFTSSNTMSGRVRAGQADGMILDVKEASITKLTFDLTVSAGDADIVVVTNVAGQDVPFGGFKVGNDRVVISRNDPAFTDGLGLTRTFLIVVMGASPNTASYTLTVTAEGASEWRADSGISLEAHLDNLKTQKVLAVSAFQGDAMQYAHYAQESDSYWPYALGVAVLLGAGVWVWKHRSVKSHGDLSYSLIGQ